MLSKQEFRVILLHEFKLKHNAVEATRNINDAWGEGTASKRTTRRWFAKFRNGDTTLKEAEGRGRPSDVDDDILKAFIEANPTVTTREAANELNVNHTTVVRHLKQLGKVKKLDKWVPHELNEKQKIRRYEVSSNHLLRNKNDPFLDRIVTCDEKWILYDNRRRSAQWLDRDEAPKHYPKPNLHQQKVMITVWWSSAGLIHYSFLKPGETITAEKYCQQIDDMHQNLRSMCPALVHRKGPIILHDNARPHVSLITKKKLYELGYEILDHPPYSPDLSPTDYHFFRNLENFIREKIFRNQSDAENAFKDFVASRPPDFYATGITKLLSRWQKCIESNGLYFD